MRNPTDSSRTSITIALSLGFLAMTLGGSALASDRKDASRDARGLVARQRPDPVAPPVATRTRVVEKAPPASANAPEWAGTWRDALRRLGLTLPEWSRF